MKHTIVMLRALSVSIHRDPITASAKRDLLEMEKTARVSCIFR